MEFEDELYKEIILEHYKEPKHKKKIQDADMSLEGINRSCGDEIEIFVKFGDNNTISEISFSGVGCSISQASASMLTDVMTGRTITEAKEIIKKFKMMLLSDNIPKFPDDMSDLESLSGVSEYPVRIKCALLSWNTLEEMLKDK